MIVHWLKLSPFKHNTSPSPLSLLGYWDGILTFLSPSWPLEGNINWFSFFSPIRTAWWDRKGCKNSSPFCQCSLSPILLQAVWGVFLWSALIAWEQTCASMLSTQKLHEVPWRYFIITGWGWLIYRNLPSLSLDASHKDNCFQNERLLCFLSKKQY